MCVHVKKDKRKDIRKGNKSLQHTTIFITVPLKKLCPINKMFNVLKISKKQKKKMELALHF